MIGEGEKIFFKVSGTHTVHLTGNFVMPLDEPSDDSELDEDAYDLSPDEDEIDLLDAIEGGDSESDELDDLEDPRIKEVEGEDDAPALKALPAAGKGKNKRPAEDSEDEEPALDEIMAKVLKQEESKTAAADTTPSEKKLTKAEKKKLKKLKNNEGQASAAPDTAITTEVKKEVQVNGTTPDSDKKKVQFAKNLEQGPTPSATKTAEKKDTSTSLGVREVQGVSIDDRKVGSGPGAKKGSKLDLRYIGKLTANNKVFDSNKSGKPFSFKLGANEVIKGWDIGLQGISAGGERRIIIPANLAYGSKGAPPDIPKNASLTFDVKCLAVK